jgi:hypothetical protein
MALTVGSAGLLFALALRLDRENVLISGPEAWNVFWPWLGCGVVSAIIDEVVGLVRGQVWPGALLGFWLGPVGWLAVLGLRDTRPRCPHCLGVMNAGARFCCRCGREIA